VHFKHGAISSIAHKLASNKGPIAARRMKRLKGNADTHLVAFDG